MDDTLVQDIAERKADCAKLRAYFREHAGWELTTDQVRKIGGPNFMQRISDIRLGKDGQPKMDIRCLPQWLHGERLERGKMRPVKLKRIEGKYQYLPHKPLGRDATTPDRQSEKHPARPQRLPL